MDSEEEEEEEVWVEVEDRSFVIAACFMRKEEETSKYN
jgi:hypothetical protein